MFQKKKILDGRSGFTLIEFLFSLVVFATVLGGALAVLQSAQQLSEDSQQKLIALSAAKTIVENMKNQNLGLDQMLGLNTVVALPNSSITIDWETSPANSALTVADSATFTVFVYWTPKGSNVACARASNIQPVTMPGCRNVQVTTLRSRRFP